jgi:hypothetical protein
MLRSLLQRAPTSDRSAPLVPLLPRSSSWAARRSSSRLRDASYLRQPERAPRTPNEPRSGKIGDGAAKRASGRAQFMHARDHPLFVGLWYKARAVVGEAVAERDGARSLASHVLRSEGCPSAHARPRPPAGTG